MDFLAKVNENIESNKTEMISSLSTLLSIPSVAGDAAGAMPFGENVDKAYEAVLSIGREAGFNIYDADMYGGHIELPARSDGNGEIVGVLGHLDVVPEGENWDFDPYGGEIIDGCLCGRGAVDDKGPVVAVLFAMKALKMAGYEPKRSIRLILGLDEETNWEGMDYYIDNVDALPDYGFTPDADFPAIHGEKGILVFDLARRFTVSGEKGLQLSSIKGGSVPNAVADSARAVIRNTENSDYSTIKEMVADFREEKGCTINCRGTGRSLEITAKGVGAHGANPQRGLNAITLLMEFLGRLNFASEETNDFIGFYNDCIGYDIHGERIGCCFEDEPSGKLIWNVGKIQLDRKSVELTVNIRYPVTSGEDEVYSGIMEVVDKYNIGIVKNAHQMPVYIAKDNPLITTLMDIYRKHTGDNDSKPVVIGGGTYARAMDNNVAFGGHFPGEPELEHQKNELISIDNMMKLATIYAEALYRLAEM